MKLRSILEQMPDELIDALARERLAQVADIRLPHAVLVDELAEVLSSSAFVASQVGLRHPPCFEILDILLNATNYTVSVEAFREKVASGMDHMIRLGSRSPVFPKPKNYDLYLRILYEAWDYEQDIDASEANILRALREELGISLMEHFVIEHHPLLHRFWRGEQAYERERNHLRGAGILFAIENSYVLAEETALLIRRAWGAELSFSQFGRLLAVLSNEDLRRILDAEGLNVSGLAEEKKARVLENYTSPRAALSALRIEDLREAAKALGAKSSGPKDELIDQIIDWMDDDEDLKFAAAAEEALQEDGHVHTPEVRILPATAFVDLLGRLTGESLYDILSRLPDLKKSGSKDERIKRLLDSPFSEHSVLSKLNSGALHELCRHLGLSPYGPKEEKIARMMEACRNFVPQGKIGGFESLDPPMQERGVGPAPPSSPVPPEAQLPRLSSVRAEFPFLSEPDHVVLSYLLDFKSLTDPELERLVQRFALPWVLPKAQMFELIRTLLANGKDVIRVRGVGDHNIYEMVL